MGKKERKLPEKKMPHVERDGFTLPHHPVGDLHTNTLGGHPLHPARLQKAPKRFP